MAFVFLPLFHRLGVTSTFEYLERRFGRSIRLLGSLVYTLKFILFIPSVIYVPALAFSQGKIVLVFNPRRNVPLSMGREKKTDNRCKINHKIIEFASKPIRLPKKTTFVIFR